MNKTIDFDMVELRLKSELNIRFDKDLSKILGFTQSSYAQRKIRQSIPYEEILILCYKKGLDINKIMKPFQMKKDS